MGTLFRNEEVDLAHTEIKLASVEMGLLPSSKFEVRDVNWRLDRYSSREIESGQQPYQDVHARVANSSETLKVSPCP